MACKSQSAVCKEPARKISKRHSDRDTNEGGNDSSRNVCGTFETQRVSREETRNRKRRQIFFASDTKEDGRKKVNEDLKEDDDVMFIREIKKRINHFNVFDDTEDTMPKSANTMRKSRMVGYKKVYFLKGRYFRVPTEFVEVVKKIIAEIGLKYAQKCSRDLQQKKLRESGSICTKEVESSTFTSEQEDLHIINHPDAEAHASNDLNNECSSSENGIYVPVTSIRETVSEITEKFDENGSLHVSNETDSDNFVCNLEGDKAAACAEAVDELSFINDAVGFIDYADSEVADQRSLETDGTARKTMHDMDNQRKELGTHTENFPTYTDECCVLADNNVDDTLNEGGINCETTMGHMEMLNASDTGTSELKENTFSGVHTLSHYEQRIIEYPIEGHPNYVYTETTSQNTLPMGFDVDGDMRGYNMARNDANMTEIETGKFGEHSKTAAFQASQVTTYYRQCVDVETAGSMYENQTNCSALSFSLTDCQTFEYNSNSLPASYPSTRNPYEKVLENVSDFEGGEENNENDSTETPTKKKEETFPSPNKINEILSAYRNYLKPPVAEYPFPDTAPYVAENNWSSEGTEGLPIAYNNQLNLTADTSVTGANDATEKESSLSVSHLGNWQYAHQMYEAPLVSSKYECKIFKRELSVHSKLKRLQTKVHKRALKSRALRSRARKALAKAIRLACDVEIFGGSANGSFLKKYTVDGDNELEGSGEEDNDAFNMDAECPTDGQFRGSFFGGIFNQWSVCDRSYMCTLAEAIRHTAGDSDDEDGMLSDNSSKGCFTIGNLIEICF